MIEFCVLGRLQVRVSGRPAEISATQLRRMLVLLLAAHGEPIRLDALAEALWAGQPPRAARKTVQVYVHRLRRLLHDDQCLRHSGAAGYLLDLQTGQVDAYRYEELVSAARDAADQGDLKGAWRMLSAAQGLWRGEPFAEVRDIAAVDTTRRQLTDLRLAALEARAKAGIELDHLDEVVSELTVAVAEHPFHEALRAQLMLALYRAGRRAEALEVYRGTRRVLAEELGVEPMPELQRLHEHILRDDPALSRSWRRQMHRFLPYDIPDFVGGAKTSTGWTSG